MIFFKQEKGEEIKSLRMKNILLGPQKESFFKNWTNFKQKYNRWILQSPINIEPNDPWKEEFSKYKARKNQKNDDIVQPESTSYYFKV